MEAQGRPGGAAWRRADHGLTQQRFQALDRVGAVALLGTEALRVNDNHAILGHALAGQSGKPQGGILWNRNAACVEAQHCRGGDPC